MNNGMVNWSSLATNNWNFNLKHHLSVGPLHVIQIRLNPPVTNHKKQMKRWWLMIDDKWIRIIIRETVYHLQQHSTRVSSLLQFFLSFPITWWKLEDDEDVNKTEGSSESRSELKESDKVYIMTCTSIQNML